MEALLNIAIRAALEAGRDILDIYDDPSQDFGIERKADNSPLTLADKAAHRRIVSHLTSTHIPVLSEEGLHESFDLRSQWQELWIVDPLDGTKEFIKKNGEFTVNIALVRSGTPVLGVIYVPVKGDLYFAAQGSAFKVEVPCAAPFPEPETLLGMARPLPLHRNDGEEMVIVASRSHMTPETEAYIEAQRSQHPVSLMSSGSSIKICLVAEGKADAYPRFAPTMEWDTAAGDAIARSSGCTVTDATTGEPLRYNKADLHNPWFLVKKG